MCANSVVVDEAADAALAGLGVPLIPWPAVAVGDVWAIPQAKVLVVLRDDVRLDVDRSRYFETDRIGIKATMRAGFAFPHPAAIVRLTDVA